MVPDSKMVAATTKWVRDLEYIHSTQKINDMSFNQLISDPSTYVKKRTQRSEDSILLRHMDDLVGTGSEEHLMSDFEHTVFDRCGSVAP